MDITPEVKRVNEMNVDFDRLVRVRFHAGCENTSCRVCFANNDVLAETLEAATNRTDIDLLGHYHTWLSDNGINPETEHGWWSKEAFNPDNVKAFSSTVWVAP